MRRGLLAVCVMVLVSSSASAERQGAVTWVLNDFPPFIVISGPDQGRGFVDLMLAELIEYLPDYAHRIEASSTARALGLMEQGEPVCHPALLKSEARLRVAVFSKPVQVVLPHHVIVLRSRLTYLAPHLDSDGAVDVERLVADPSLVTSITDQRVFSPIINDALLRHAGAPHIHRTGGQFIASFHQLAAGWVDYLFAYPVEPRWYMAQEEQPEEVDLVALPIAGNEAFTLGYIACTRGAWGQALIARINEVVGAMGPRPPWFDHQLSMLDDASAQRLLAIVEREQPFDQ